MRSKRLRPGFCAVSNGFRLPTVRLGAVGMRVRRMGWPLALAPSNSRMARRASERDS